MALDTPIFHDKLTDLIEEDSNASFPFDNTV